MITDLKEEIRCGSPLYVSEVRSYFARHSGAKTIAYSLLLPDTENHRVGSVRVPAPEDLSQEERAVAVDYLQAEFYNLLTTLGGRALSIYLGKDGRVLLPFIEPVVSSFQVALPRSERRGVGRVVNVIERMLAALDGKATEPAHFDIKVIVDDPPALPENYSFHAETDHTLVAVTENLKGKVFCGLDVGGTDIKAALVVNGTLVGLKEHDWNPAVLTNVEEIIGPIVDTVRMLAARAVAGERSDEPAFASLYEEGLDKNIAPGRLHEISDALEEQAGSLRVFDGIGVSFPDVVVRNKVVGGEVPKTLGMRSNAGRDFEEQFSLLTKLDDTLAAYCVSDGRVYSANDGPMAAFTAAVELSASPQRHLAEKGVFAHSLGTDLGSGLVLADGSIPEIPLEIYNMIIDVGSAAFRALPALDVRSLRNTNTDISGTMQRFTSQTGAFRVAYAYAVEHKPELIDRAREKGYLRSEGEEGEELVIVPEQPEDMRKAYLAYLMAEAETEPAIAEVFRDIGEFLALTWSETERILGTGLSTRFLFGRLVKSDYCFSLMKEGARRRALDLEFIAADSSMAYTPLMKELAASEEFTVAQFGQAIGAVYFANR
ncbi:MAG: hypothetical protein ACLFP4_00645 [Spirochaetales bacterium]